MKIKLKEVLWEVTNRCNRDCSFCGSKGIMNNGPDTSPSERKQIAEEIGSMAEVVTFTGGEPLLLSMEDLLELKEVFDTNNTIMDLVTNGDKLHPDHFDLFRHIGISVNSKHDAENITHNLNMMRDGGNDCSNKIVFISNMNKINFFELDDIISAASENNVAMQFQLTMYKGKNNEMLNGSDIVDLREKIERICKDYEVNYVLADNLQERHECTAGIYSCGVLFNGDVVPCLSERSWNEDMQVQGNILKRSLESIWINEFVRNRFYEECPSCRDCFNYVRCVKVSGKTANLSEDLFNPTNIFHPKEVAPEFDPIMTLYGVFYPNERTDPQTNKWAPQVYTYGVSMACKPNNEC